MASPLTAGLLRERIVLQRAGVSRDTFGQLATTWSDLASVSAQHLPVSDGEQVRAAQLGASLTDRFRIRIAPQWADLNAKDQLMFMGRGRGRIYNITGVKPLLEPTGRQVGLEITATAQADS